MHLQNEHIKMSKAKKGLTSRVPSIRRQPLSQQNQSQQIFMHILIQQISKQIHFKSSHDVLHREMRYV